MRNALISEFSSDVLGPLAGASEILETRPTDRYIVGILSPRDAKLAEDDISEDEAIDTIGNDGNSLSVREDNVDTGVSLSAGDELSPVIDSRSFPKNMGISFNCIHQGTSPSFELVITYARYRMQPGKKWKRMPRAIHLKSEDLISAKNYFAIKDVQTGELETVGSNGESYLYRSIRSAHDAKHGTIVTLMLVNNEEQSGLRNSDEKFIEKLIFQPEIRVNFSDGTSFKSEGEEPAIEDESYEEFRYRGREQRARGHLCSATWGDFDPQCLDDGDKRDLMVQLAGEDSREPEIDDFSTKPPFYWVDGNHPALANVNTSFRQPTLRSEYLPMIVLPAPDMDPTGRSWKRCPSAKEISEASESAAMKELLQPLAEGYDDWISGTLSGAPQEVQDKAKDALKRIEEGIDLLCSDQTARLAFNIANRAIYQSNKWANEIKSKNNPNHVPREFVWRKFQLAFALSTLESVSNPQSKRRNELDLLWVATGGGKTEAYLLTMAYSIVMRRLQAKNDQSLPQWHGVDVITRYTLRLLTIQQSRRTLGIVSALEWLRNTSWVPQGIGGSKFSEQPVSLGIWVGGSLTPNRLLNENKYKNLQKQHDVRFLPAIPLLKFGHQLKPSQKRVAPEPAQILTCPACDERLSLPMTSNSDLGITEIKWVCESTLSDSDIKQISLHVNAISSIDITHHDNNIKTLSVSFKDKLQSESEVQQAWQDLLAAAINTRGGNLFLKCFRAGRPGYFPKLKDNRSNEAYDFEIHCPNPKCDLNQHTWTGELPSGVQDGNPRKNDSKIYLSQGWRNSQGDHYGRGMPIPAYTVDEQVYSRAPSIIVATVDKFAQLPKNPRSGILFGSIQSHSHNAGYSRNPADLSIGLESAIEKRAGLLPPNLIVQDELHLIEGPLGSMVGFYETAIEKLANEHAFVDDYQVKYIASSATINKGEEQVQCLFDRTMNLFPPKGRDWKDRGLILEKDDEKPSSKGDRKGRLFMGICPIGVTGLSTQREIFSSMLYHPIKHVEANGIPSDRYWTVVGYYNAVRELAGARTLLSFEVQEAISRLCRHRNQPQPIDARPDQGRIIELSGRMESSHLPQMLSNLESRNRQSTNSTDVLLSTSMFGTGVDVDRLNLMIVSGQPKTTAQYIQAAGRVGRDKGGLVLTYLRCSRPRDLDHYERFIGYHAQINRHVEAVTVRPFAEPVIDKAGGPVQLAWLRNSRDAIGTPGGDPWSGYEAAHAFPNMTSKNSDIDLAIRMIEDRHSIQSPERQIIQSPPNYLNGLLEIGYDRWMYYCRSAEKHVPTNMIQWDYGRKKLQNPPGIRWSIFAGEPQVGSKSDIAVYSSEYQTPNSLRTTDGEIQVRSRGDKL